MRSLATLFLLVLTQLSYAQLAPGFDSKEYLSMLSVSSRQVDTLLKTDGIPAPDGYSRVYRSPVVGLDNRWDLWLSKDGKTGVISIRGTVGTASSWLANVYCPMVAATGQIKLSDSVSFSYQLAADKRAAVHLGWLVALGHIAPDIEAKIRDQYQKGVKQFIIMGHSQGGAIAFLLRSHLQYRAWTDQLPKDIVYKTYCSAGPKPGNLYYAYDYDFINRGGWAFNVVNAADWVPETPFSIQQTTDFNELSPFPQVKKMLKKQKLLLRWYVGGMYNKMNRSTRKAERRFEKYLGKRVGKFVKRSLPQLEAPEFVHSQNYMRAGTPIILMPDDAYFKEFPNDPNQKAGIWNHHLFKAYYSLAQKWF